jgi:glycosyltransferase involved in cell wall biosynthesis
MRPMWIPANIKKCYDSSLSSSEKIEAINAAYKKMSVGTPVISIVIPAYNEEDSIIQTLYSLTNNICSKSVEIIVVNNNSTDKTEALVLSTGIQCPLETKKGIAAARNAGLALAKGSIVLNADADSIYPPDWIEEMSKPFFNDEKVVVVYGRLAFIPIGNTGRFTYFFYEYFADFFRFLNKYLKDEAVNVYGFNSGYRREQGLLVDGFNHPPQTGTDGDGWIALKLRDQGYGKLFYVTKPKAMVWTSDRRIQIDGGLWKALLKRIRRLF